MKEDTPEIEKTTNIPEKSESPEKSNNYIN